MNPDEMGFSIKLPGGVYQNPRRWPNPVFGFVFKSDANIHHESLAGEFPEEKRIAAGPLLGRARSRACAESLGTCETHWRLH